jgi:Flp pilus assembly pilin Flp
MHPPVGGAVLASLLSRCWARRDERGASAVEFALLIPLLIMLLIGTTTAGLAYSDHVSVTNAAREGSRYGAAADASVPSAWAASVQTRVKDVYFNAAGTAPTDDQVCVRLVNDSGTSLAADLGSSCGTEPAAPAGMHAGSCAVKVWMSKPAVIRLAVLPDLNSTIKAQSVSYYGRTVGTTCTAE